MKLRHFMPACVSGFVEPRTGDSKLGICGKFLQHQLHEVRLETQVGIEPEDEIDVLPSSARKELHNHRFAARFAGTISRQMYRLDPRRHARCLVEDLRSPICRAVIDNDPALRQTRLRRHARNQPRKELLFVAGRRYRNISIHLSLNARVHITSQWPDPSTGPSSGPNTWLTSVGTLAPRFGR